MVLGRGLLAAALLAATLVGCASSSGDEPDDQAATQDQSKSDDGADPAKVRGGVASPGSLTAFDCVADGDGVWSATGTLTNAESDPADFRVTIVVAPPDASRGKAREITLTDVPSGETADFEAKKLPATSGDDTACAVQVALLR